MMFVSYRHALCGMLMRRHAEYLEAVETTPSATASETTQRTNHELVADSSAELTAANAQPE